MFKQFGNLYICYQDKCRFFGKAVWIEEKQTYSIIENNPKMCYFPFPKENRIISSILSCIFSGSQEVYHQCTSKMLEGKLQYYVVPHRSVNHLLRIPMDVHCG